MALGAFMSQDAKASMGRALTTFLGTALRSNTYFGGGEDVTGNTPRDAYTQRCSAASCKDMQMSEASFTTEVAVAMSSLEIDFTRNEPRVTAPLVVKTHPAFLVPKESDDMYKFVHSIVFFGMIWAPQSAAFLEALWKMGSSQRMRIIASVGSWTRNYPDQTSAVVKLFAEGRAYEISVIADGAATFTTFLQTIPAKVTTLKEIIMPSRLYHIIWFLMLMFCNADLTTSGVESTIPRPSPQEVWSAVTNILFTYCTTIYNVNHPFPGMLTAEAVAEEMVDNILNRIAGKELQLMDPATVPAERLSAFVVLVQNSLKLPILKSRIRLAHGSTAAQLRTLQAANANLQDKVDVLQAIIDEM
jgi:hypothetical protein